MAVSLLYPKSRVQVLNMRSAQHVQNSERVPISGQAQRANIYILFEHQNSVDHLMAYRKLKYVSHISNEALRLRAWRHQPTLTPDGFEALAPLFSCYRQVASTLSQQRIFQILDAHSPSNQESQVTFTLLPKAGSKAGSKASARVRWPCC
jgi:hypothetical protein